MSKSSVATTERGPTTDTAILDGIADAWTRARGADASAIGNLNRCSLYVPVCMLVHAKY